MEPKHIAIAGNIGAGKTTLTELLSKHFNWNAHYESVEDNPYLNNYYNDMQRWSFNLQIYFLNSRFRQVQAIRENKKPTIQDRSIYEDAYVFAPNLREMGLMDSRDFDNYKSLFDLMMPFLKAPDLIIYLKADVSTLVKNIHKRGREYESTINIDYLDRLNQKYDQWMENYSEGKMIVFNVDNKDFLNNSTDMEEMVDKINAEIHGLF